MNKLLSIILFIVFLIMANSIRKEIILFHEDMNTGFEIIESHLLELREE